MPPLVCLHCSGSGPRQWAKLAAALGPGHALVAPALIGYGEGAPSTAATEVTLDDEAARVEAIVDGASGPVCLVGHSYGGAVATRVALRRHDRIAGLVLYEPVLFSVIARDAEDGGAGREIAATSAAIGGDMRAMRVERAAARFVDYWSGDGAWKAMDARRREAICVRMPKVVQEFAALFGDALPTTAYRRLSMPVLWLEGEATRSPPRAVARRLLPVLSDARHVRIPGAGHMGPLTHPADVNAEILGFVRALDDAGRPRLATQAAGADRRSRRPAAQVEAAAAFPL